MDEASRIVLWGGGIWEWLDPVTVISAVHELALARSGLRLVFMGVRRPNSRGAERAATERAMAVAEELGVLGSVVIFNENWVPYKERGAWLREADIGVSAHFDTVETRFAFRTRLLDYLWADLPIVTSSGDVIGELVERERLGASVPPKNVEKWVVALAVLLDDDEARRHASARMRAVKQSFEWSRIVEPLARLVSEPGRQLKLPSTARLAGTQEVYLRGRTLLTARGAGAFKVVVSNRLRRPARLR